MLKRLFLFLSFNGYLFQKTIFSQFELLDEEKAWLELGYSVRNIGNSLKGLVDPTDVPALFQHLGSQLRRYEGYRKNLTQPLLVVGSIPAVCLNINSCAILYF